MFILIGADEYGKVETRMQMSQKCNKKMNFGRYTVSIIKRNDDSVRCPADDKRNENDDKRS